MSRHLFQNNSDYEEMSSQSSDILVMEQHKENIQALSGGRSVSKLVVGLKNSNKLGLQHKETLRRERDQFETQLESVDELDDPLQSFIDYINWVHNNYPQGTNNESGLLSLLERGTSHFRDVQHYKNDSRYLKIWLEYANYSDAPRDIFVYLAKKEIGNQLALYYEEFARFLEVTGKLIDAKQIYELGIETQARPLARLERSFTTFKERNSGIPNSVSEFTPIIRNALAMKRGEPLATPVSDSNPSKRQKLSVFKDEPEQNQSVLYSIFNNTSDNNDLGTIKSRIKENIVSSKPWAGEVFKQKLPLERSLSERSSSERPSQERASSERQISSGSSAKFTVYRDMPAETSESPPKPEQHTEQDENGYVHTIIKNPGKRTEKVHLNVDLLYPSSNVEFCPLEILILSKSKSKITVKEIENNDIFETTRIVDNIDSSTQQDLHEAENAHDVLVPPAFESTHTFTIPLADDDTVMRRDRPRSPTLTMFSRLVNHEVINMFNDAAQDLNSDFEDEQPNETTTSNYDGFVTETIQVKQDNTPAAGTLQRITTPPTDREDDPNDAHSSPFVERPTFSTELVLVNPVDAETREKLINDLSIPLSLYPGYYEMPNMRTSRIQKFREITNKATKSIPKGSQSAMIDFCGEEIYCLRYELGVGGFGIVYLIETGTTGVLKAIKIESPTSKWEFYILSQIHRRLIGRDKLCSRFIVRPESFYYFQDESYLLMEFCSQGTFLDVVNYYKHSYNRTLEECLSMHLTVELIKSIETLHSIGILHGDLKADNCMVRFEQLQDSEELNETYETSPKSHWGKKSITLIDFGRAIDMNLFSGNVQFVSDWKTDSQDCTQMRENKPWSFEADYYGIACIIHSLLFGSYIKTKTVGNSIVLETPLKRYWQVEIWGSLFELLLNPYDNSHPKSCPKKPILDSLKRQRLKLEDWLIQNSKSKNLKSIVLNLEHDLNLANRKRID